MTVLTGSIKRPENIKPNRLHKAKVYIPIDFGDMHNLIIVQQNFAYQNLDRRHLEHVGGKTKLKSVCFISSFAIRALLFT